MSDSVIFDQLSFVQRGVDVGVPREHAEWLAKEHTQTLEKNLATKTDVANIQRDIESLRKDTMTAIEGLRKDTTVELAKLETKLTAAFGAVQFKIVAWNTGILVAVGGILAATLK